MNNDEFDIKLISLIIISSVVLLGTFGVLIHSCYIAEKATLGKLEQEVDRRNFEQSQSYREGLRRDFDELMLSYSKAKTEDERSAILSVLKHRVQGAPPDAVPQDVKIFLASKGR